MAKSLSIITSKKSVGSVSKMKKIQACLTDFPKNDFQVYLKTDRFNLK